MTCSKCGGLCYLDRDLEAVGWACFSCGSRTFPPFQPYEVKRANRASETFCPCGVYKPMKGRRDCRYCNAAKNRRRKQLQRMRQQEAQP
jgi:hypothetical protein